MKKTFKTLAFMLLAVLAFSSCEDVPEPYNLPSKIENGTIVGGTAITGTPVTCSEALAIINALADGASTTEIYSVTGYITDVFAINGKPCFYISDTPGGGKDIEAFSAVLPEGVTEFVIGQKVTITGKLQKYVDKNNKVVPEVNTPTVTILEGEGSTGTQGGTTEGIKVNCAEAVRATSALADGATSTETYSITGYITEIIGAPSPSSKTGQMQQSFWMADTKDGGKVFEAYWANLPEGVDAFVAGSKVTITGKLYKYVKNGEMTAEVKNADVVVLEQGDGGSTGDTGDTGNTGDATSVTCAQAVAATNALADGATSTEAYSITGYITKIIGAPNASKTTGQMQQSFWMADTKDGGEVFEAYWANLPEGVDAFVVGSKVTITGQLYKYVKNGAITPEIKNADVVILEVGEGETGGGDNIGGGDNSGNTGNLSSLVNGGFESWVSNTEAEGWKSTCSASSADVSSNTDAHSGSYSCAVAGIASGNKRLATKEITLEAGSYTFSFYAKATTADLCQTRAGYVPLKADGSVGSYQYGDYADLNNSGWTLVSYDFTLNEQTTVCLVMMNPKTNAGHTVSQTILVDDATLVKK